MKIETIWNRIGKQNAGLASRTDAVVFLGGKTYPITGIRYEHGKMTGFEAGEPKEEERQHGEREEEME